MGKLKPGATYIYENVAGTIFAREFGSSKRHVVGYDSGVLEAKERRYYMNEMNNVLAMCEKDPAMKDLLDKLFLLYNLKKNHE